MDSDGGFYYYYERDEVSDEDEDEDEGLMGDADSEDLQSDRTEISYTVLSEADINLRQEEEIADLSNTISVSTTEACILLRHYNWNASKVNDEWFSGESRVRETVGLVDNQREAAGVQAGELKCKICFDDEISSSEMISAPCGHNFCRCCWKGYVTTSINDGPGCLSLRCPHPSCVAAVDQDMVRALVPDDDYAKYSRFLLRSYVEGNKKAKWCPAPGCDFAILYFAGSASYDVVCRCGHAFCWNCASEAHRPVDCCTVAEWILKNSAESENTKWILANSKPCPKCKRPIQKFHGCMHMACSAPCYHQFCWLCLGSWKEHGMNTGGNYACNRYEIAKRRGDHDDEKRMQRDKANASNERYTHYYERFASNQSSMKKAVAVLNDLRDEKLEKLSGNLGLPASEVQFVINAWEQIVGCWRVLGWTYAYGYYLPENEQHAKKELFEYLQGEAETGLERLHKCAEIELQLYLDEETVTLTLPGFPDYQTKLAGLTSVTQNYFGNLVRALEDGLQEVWIEECDTQTENLVKPSDKAMVVLDATLCDAVYKGAIKKGSSYPTEIYPTQKE